MSRMPGGDKSAYESAIRRAIAECESLDQDIREQRRRLLEMEGRRIRLQRMMDCLRPMLTPEQETALFGAKDGLPAENAATTAGPKAGKAHVLMMRMFASAPARTWTAASVLAALEDPVVVSQTQVYNFLQYFRRAGILKRIGRGRYVFADLNAETVEGA